MRCSPFHLCRREAGAVYMRLFTAANIPVGARHRAASGTRRRRRARRDTRCSISRWIRCPTVASTARWKRIDMGVPVVTLRGRKHGERTSASILTNLGATQTIADSGSAYVDIAVRLATDPTSRARSRRRSVPESPSRR